MVCSVSVPFAGRYEAGAIWSQSEAQKLLDLWRSEGREQPMAVNISPLYESVEAWIADR
jgi:hypothetical protein